MVEEDSVRNHLPGFYHSLGASGQNTVLTSDSPAGAGVHRSHSSRYSKMPCLKASLKIQALLDFSHWRRFASDSPGSRRQQEGRLTYNSLTCSFSWAFARKKDTQTQNHSCTAGSWKWALLLPFNLLSVYSANISGEPLCEDWGNVSLDRRRQAARPPGGSGDE